MKKTVSYCLRLFLIAAVLILAFPQKSYAKKKTIDVIVFAGQSNMMGHGNAAQATSVSGKAAKAYLPVTAAGKISAFYEPFGQLENDKYFNSIFGKENYATGSLVSSFIKNYYKQTKTPVLAVPAAMMGSGSQSWASNRYKGVISRVNAAEKTAKKAGYSIGHVYMVWMQGESDALAMQRNADGSCDNNMSGKQHIKNVKKMLSKVQKKTNITKCFVIVIPSYYGADTDPYGTKWSIYYKKIQQAQVTLCDENDDFIMAYAKTPSLGREYFHADNMHLMQPGLNKIGLAAGKTVGKYAKKHKNS
ncbi:MAG: sialate O-acetylesterase [Lachnospiraceae bacterium]|nr:sialate O-acetylesterase [Lachnospiraceae bacterium]